MGIFSKIANVVKGFVGTGDEQSGFSLVPTFVETGASLLGTALSLRANKNATEKFVQAQALMERAVREGNEQAISILQQIVDETQPAVDQLRRISARDPNQLTPGQEIELGDARRTTANRLATTGLRGSGRAEVAAIRDVEGRVKGRQIESNLARQERATTALVGQRFSAGTGQANIAARQGSQLAGIAGQTGLARAGEEISGGNLRGRAIGEIGSVIAESVKNRERRRRETTPTAGTV